MLRFRVQSSSYTQLVRRHASVVQYPSRRLHDRQAESGLQRRTDNNTVRSSWLCDGDSRLIITRQILAWFIIESSFSDNLTVAAMSKGKRWAVPTAVTVLDTFPTPVADVFVRSL